jgi:hypothetical protein
LDRLAPVFVVGIPRSGTTLMAAMLGSHPHLDSGPETHLLAHLEGTPVEPLLDRRRWPGPATDFVCSLRLRDVPVHQLYGRTREQVVAHLAARSPSVAALLESLTAERAAARGKLRWVEKTPRHLEHVATIRATWPEALIVRMVRDPRDVALSLAKVPFGSPSVVINLCTVARLERGSARFFRSDTRSLTVRFEDLLADPERELRRICEALGEPYDPAMIERRGVTGDMAAAHEWWKGDVGGPLDRTRAERWRIEMPADVQAFAALHDRRQIRAHGYPGARAPRYRVAILPMGDRLAAQQEWLLLGLAAIGGDVIDPVPTQVPRLVRADRMLFWGLPGQLGVEVGSGVLERATAWVALGGALALARLRRRPAVWVPRTTTWPRRRLDPGERMAARLLRRLGRRSSLQRVGRDLGLPRRFGPTDQTLPEREQDQPELRASGDPG